MQNFSKKRFKVGDIIWVRIPYLSTEINKVKIISIVGQPLSDFDYRVSEDFRENIVDFGNYCVIDAECYATEGAAVFARDFEEAI